MFPLLSSVDRLRMQLRCVNRTKSARRSASALTEAPEAFIVFILAGCGVHVSGHIKNTALWKSDDPRDRIIINPKVIFLVSKAVLGGTIQKINDFVRYWKKRIHGMLIIFKILSWGSFGRPCYSGSSGTGAGVVEGALGSDVGSEGCGTCRE